MCLQLTNLGVARQTLAQFSASLLTGDGLNLRVRHIMWPLTPWLTSPHDYHYPSASCLPPSKDNATICLFNCLSVNLFQGFSVGVYGFSFSFIFIYLSCLKKWGKSGPRNRQSLFGLVSHGYKPPPHCHPVSTALYSRSPFPSDFYPPVNLFWGNSCLTESFCYTTFPDLLAINKMFLVMDHCRDFLLVIKFSSVSSVVQFFSR